MVDRALRGVHALTALTTAVVLLAGCAPDLGSIARDVSIDPAALVRLSDTYAVAPNRTASGVELVAFLKDRDGRWVPQIIASGGGGATAAHLVTMGGQTGQEWNSFLYGTAPPTASRVTVGGLLAVGGRVAGGAWVLAFRQKDLSPDLLSWSVIDAHGAVVASGTGITP